jgi:hypothetical protein
MVVTADNLRGLPDEQVWAVVHDSAVESTAYRHAVLELQMRVGERHLKAADESAAGGKRLATLTQALVRATWGLVGVTAVLAICAAIPAVTPFFAKPDRAWVLWRHFTSIDAGTPYGGLWLPEQAFDGQRRCEPIGERLNGRVAEEANAKGSSLSWNRYVCLPDTVDPRGPKEK